MNMEQPPNPEEEKTFIVVEQQGKGFTVVDENKEHYLWQDEHRQVLWTKDVNEAHTKRKELQKKELEERTNKENTPMVPEELEGKEVELVAEQEKDRTLATPLETELEVLRYEGLTVDQKFEEAKKRVHAKIDANVAKALGPTDEEKLAQIRKDILKDTFNKRQEHLKDTLKKTQQEQNVSVITTRQAYTDAYGQSVEKVNGLKKLGYKIGNFFGFNRKDVFTETGTRAEDLQTQVNKNEYETEKNKTLTDRFSEKMTSEKDTGREKKRDWTTAELETRDRRYKNILRNKGGESFSKEKELEFVKSENEILNEKKKAEWETHKNKTEKLIQEEMEMAKAYLDQNPKLKKMLGNKWFRLGATSVGIGLLTGGIGSVAFWGSRALRVTGGALGAAGGKLVSDKLIKTKEILDSRVSQLEKDYKDGKYTASEYDKQKENIDLEITRWERLKNLIVVGSGVGVGYGAGYADTHYIHPTMTETHVGQTAPGPDGNTPQGDTPTVVPDDWLVHKGQGIEHTFIRQIEHSEQLRELLGYKADMDLHDFAGKAAHQMALSNGYVDNLGHEVRITSAGIDKAAYELRINNGAIEIHEHFDGKEIETHAGHETAIEKNIEDTKAEGGYETMHDGSHHTTPTTKHIATLKAEIDNAYPKREDYQMEALKPSPVPPAHLEPIRVGPNGVIGAPTEPIKVGPNGPIGPQPEPIKVSPTGPITPVDPNYQPRLPHTNGEPRTYGDPMHNGRYHPAEPDAGKNQYLESKKVSSVGGNSAGENLAQNSAPAGKDFFTILAEAFFGKDTPEIPQMTATPGAGFDDLSKAA